MKQEPEKRIVSQGEFAGRLTRKTLWGMGSIGLLMSACMVLCSAFLLMLWGCLIAAGSVVGALKYLGIAGGFGVVGAFLLYAAVRSMKQMQGIEVGVPLTRANTADLPAPQSLVRASQEPLQAQKTVLLRAAIETSAKQEELLRASAGEQE